MSIRLRANAPEELPHVIDVLGQWQQDGAPLQLHPGDLGWHARRGATTTAAATLTWRRADDVLAIALLDGPGVLRLTTAPHADHDDELAATILADLTDPSSDLVPEGELSVECPTGSPVQEVLAGAGWARGEAWSPLQRDLRAPVRVPGSGLEVVEVGEAGRASAYAHVVRSAFGSTTFTERSWQAMAAGGAHRQARSLLGLDADGEAVAVVTAWSAGSGRPGLLEPVAVHADHRGRGYGTAMCLAAAAHLRDTGSRSAQVCPPSALAPAVATYRKSGFVRLPERFDRVRP